MGAEGVGWGTPSAQLTSAGCRVIRREGGREREEVGCVSTTNGCLRKAGSVLPGDRLYPLAAWSAAGSVQHVCRKSRLLNTLKC